MSEDSILDPDDEPISLDDDDDEPISLDDGPASPADDEEESIKLVESDEGSELTPGALKTFGAAAMGGTREREFQRPLNVDGAGATRCRLFHSKIAVASLEYMESQINEWIDGEKIEVKQVGHIIGTMEGKRPEPNLLVMIWY